VLVALAAVPRVMLGLLLIGGLLALGTICAMKGKGVYFALGWFSGIFWVIGAIRIAKPKSRWARRHYRVGGRRMAIAERRFSRD
jgi:lysyl-tRNA synthetase, class II